MNDLTRPENCAERRDRKRILGMLAREGGCTYCKPCCLEYKRDGKVRQLAMKRLWAANDDDRKRAGMLFVPIGRAA